MLKNKLSDPYFRNQQWNVDENISSETSNAVLVRTFDTRSEADTFIEEYNNAFDPEDKDMWLNVLNALQDDEDGQGLNLTERKGYLFDHFKALETQIKHWMEKNRG